MTLLDRHWPSTRTICIAFRNSPLRIFALASDIEDTFFDSIAIFPMAFVRPLHYPPQEVGNGNEPGIAAHTDFAAFTVLCQDAVETLEVLNKHGVWIPALPIARTFVINIANYLQLLTYHRPESTVHRVVNRTGKGRDIQSPFFFVFDWNAELGVLSAFLQANKMACSARRERENWHINQRKTHIIRI